MNSINEIGNLPEAVQFRFGVKRRGVCALGDINSLQRDAYNYSKSFIADILSNHGLESGAYYANCTLELKHDHATNAVGYHYELISITKDDGTDSLSSHNWVYPCRQVDLN